MIKSKAILAAKSKAIKLDNPHNPSQSYHENVIVGIQWFADYEELAKVAVHGWVEIPVSTAARLRNK